MEEKSVKLISKDYILVIMAAMGTSFVNYFFFSSLSLFAEKITGTVVFAGFLSLAYSSTALIVRPLSGIISDRHGRIKILLIGSLLSAVACLLYSFTVSIALLMLVRILNGIGMSMTTTSAGAAVPDIVPKERLAEGVGLFGLYATVAQAVGPLIALAIVGNGDIMNFHTLFYVSAIFCTVSFICGCFIKYERNARKKQLASRESASEQPSVGVQPVTGTQAAANTDSAAGDQGANGVPTATGVQAATGTEATTGVQAAASDQDAASGWQESDVPEGKIIFGFDVRVFGPALVMLLYFFGISSILSYLTLYGKNRGFQVEHLGLFFLVSACGLLFARLFFGRIVDRRGGDVVVIPGLIVIALCLFAIPLMPTLPLLICVAFPYGMATGAVAPSLNSIMFKRCSPKRRGTVSAAYFASVDIGITIGAPVMGWVADRANFTWVYWASAAVVGLTVLIYVFFISDKQFQRRVAASAAQN